MPSDSQAELFTTIRALVAKSSGHDLVLRDTAAGSAHISNHTGGCVAADELRDLAFALIDAGHQVKAAPTGLRVTNDTGEELTVSAEAAGSDATLSDATIETIYWANFYAHVTYDSGSTFQAAVDSLPDAPKSIVDIGCGDGRDSFAFGRAGRKVVGIDRSHIGVQHASKHSAELGLGELVSFRAIDVSDVDAVRAVLTEVTSDSPDAPVLFYMRFFLHSIPADVQDGLLTVISEVARPNDVLAAEFRTDKDEALTKVHGGHFRRYQNAADFRASLVGQYGFDQVLTEDQGTGLSPYRDEDPELYRVIARRSS